MRSMASRGYLGDVGRAAGDVVRIMEIAHLIVLNKSDLDGAESCLRSPEAMVHIRSLASSLFTIRVRSIESISRVRETVICNRLAQITNVTDCSSRRIERQGPAVVAKMSDAVRDAHFSSCRRLERLPVKRKERYRP